MKVILLENVRKVGSIGDVIDVKRGFARNYLLSKRKALFASKENKELYGSVKPTEIAKVLNENEKIEINPSLIQPIKEIKSIGSFKVVLNLHPEVQTEISIKVLPEDSK